MYCHSLYRRIFGAVVMIDAWLYVGTLWLPNGVDVTFTFSWVFGES